VTPIIPTSWPPIITTAKLPRTVVWRDRLLTAVMWLLLFWLARRELLALWDVSGAMIVNGRLHFTSWHGRWVLLHPYLKTIGALAVWELAWAIVGLWRRHHYSGLPQPQPLTAAEESRKFHNEPSDIEEWRKLKICVVEFDEDGTLRCRSTAALGAPVAG
jgi:poly-beta-1,6-N-acetyl-D-glucosamine biosynthesis protein PgaD